MMLITIGMLFCACNTDDVTVSAVRVMSAEAYENMSANMSAVAVNAFGTSLADTSKHVLAACMEFVCEAAARTGMVEVLKKEVGSGGSYYECEEKYAGFASPGSPTGYGFVVKKCLRSHITPMMRTCSCSVDHVCQDFLCERERVHTVGSMGLIGATRTAFGSGGGMNQCEEKYEGFATNGFEILTIQCLRESNGETCSCERQSKHACPSTTTACEASARGLLSIKFNLRNNTLKTPFVKLYEEFHGPESSWFKKIGDSRVQGKGREGVCIEIYQGSDPITKNGQETSESQGVECHRPLFLDKCGSHHCQWQ